MLAASPQFSFALFFFFQSQTEENLCPGKYSLNSLATGWEEGESLTLENEDVVAMGTVNPSVTQRVPFW